MVRQSVARSITGICFLCKRDARHSLGLPLEYIGSKVICHDCLKELKKAIDSMIKAEKELAEKKKQAKKAQENAKKLEGKKGEKTRDSK